MSLQIVLNYSCKFFQFIFGEAIDSPILHGNGADAFVKVDGRLVPVEANPFHAAAVALQCQLGQMLQQGFSVAEASLLWQHEEIFQIKTFSSHKSGEVMEKEGEADNHAIFLSKHHFRFVAYEECLMESLLGGLHLMGKFFILCQFLDVFQNSGGLILSRRPDGECGHGRFFR